MNASKVLTAITAAVATAGAIGLAQAQTSSTGAAPVTGTATVTPPAATTPNTSAMPADPTTLNQRGTAGSTSVAPAGGVNNSAGTMDQRAVPSTGGSNANSGTTRNDPNALLGNRAPGATGSGTANDAGGMTTERPARADRN